MGTVASKDGTIVAFDQSGQGPVLILVGGTFEFRALDSETSQLAAFPPLSQHFTVVHYDRRGRGHSTDTLPYAVEREIEDIAALIDATGGSAFISGISAGAALAMEATIALGDKIKKLGMYEAPYIADEAVRQGWSAYCRQLAEHLAAGRRGDAVGSFMMMTGMPAEHLPEMRQHPLWPLFESVAPTLAYDAAIVGDEAPVPVERAARVTVPALVMAGSESYPFMQVAAELIARAIPNARHRTLQGQSHVVEAAAIGPALIEFFTADLISQ